MTYDPNTFTNVPGTPNAGQGVRLGGPRPAQAPGAPQPGRPGQGFDLMALIAALSQMQNQTDQTRLQGDREAQSGRRLGMDGQDIQPQASPFTAPVFKSVAERQADMAGWGAPAAGSIPGRTDFASNPYAFGALPQAPVAEPASPPMTPGSWVPSMDGGQDFVGGKVPGQREGYMPPIPTNDTPYGTTQPKKPKRTGSSFGFNASPKPGFSMGVGR